MLALIAGRGALPGLVAAAQAEAPLVCAMDGAPPEGLDVDLGFRLEQLGSLLDGLEARAVTQVCFCGAIARPRFDPAALDAATLPLVPIMQKALAAGDDGALRAVIEIFEARGFGVRAVQDLVPGLLAPAGALSQHVPDDQIRKDVARGRAVLEALAPLDIGQACVVGAGQVLGVEAFGGTDHLLQTLPHTPLRAQAVLVKAPKAGQDQRIDLPTVGPDTITAVQSAGLAGLAVAAGGVLVVDQAECKARAEAAGLVFWSFEAA